MISPSMVAADNAATDPTRPRRALSPAPAPAPAPSPAPRGSKPSNPPIPPPPSATPVAAQPRDPLVGRMLGGYRLKRKLGQGGMGVVYLATHVHLGIEAAVKILTAGYADDPTYLARFFREAREAMRLSHPNIVRMFHADRATDGLPFLAMEFVDGETLTSLIPARGMSEGRAAEWLALLCGALGHAHRLGLVHRDIKPENIMVERDRRRPRITDFGLLRRIGAASVTHHDEVIGTPQFMAPEQWRGANVDGRADIYALGVTAFVMLTGRLPIEADSAPAVLKKLMHNERLSLRQARPGLDAGLTKIIERMMEIKLEARTQHAEEAEAALNEWLKYRRPTSRIAAVPLNLRSRGRLSRSGRDSAIRGLRVAALPPPRRAWTWLEWTVAAAIIIVIGAALAAIVAWRG